MRSDAMAYARRLVLGQHDNNDPQAIGRGPFPALGDHYGEMLPT
jgi:hypothetical protein